MLLKLSAALMITLAGALTGIKQANSIRVKRDMSIAVCELFQRSVSLLRSQALNVYELVVKLREYPSLDRLRFLYDVQADFLNGKDFHREWHDAVSSQTELMCEEKELLLRFGEILGTTDIEGQLSGISVLIAEAGELVRRRSDEYLKRGKLCRSIWTLFGLMTGILLI